MGVDLVAWRNCELQRKLDLEGFLDALMLLRYRDAAAAKLAPDKVATTKLRLKTQASGVLELSFAELSGRCQEFSEAGRRCQECPATAPGAAPGCAAHLAYPLDTAFEEAVFAYFTAELRDPNAVSSWLCETFVAAAPGDTQWHARGAAGAAAERAEPLRAAVEIDGTRFEFDSAQLLDTLFSSAAGEDVPAFGRFWRGFLAHVGAQTDEATSLHEVLRAAQLCVWHCETGAAAKDLPLYVST